jgi:RNA polymerase sigma factor for flagellar operon FliA
LSLDEQDGLPGEDGLKLSETIADQQAADALKDLEEDQMRGAIREAIQGLPDKERLVVAMYHFEELNFKEIGRVLGITESRVCQIHSKAMMKLRSRVRLQARK